MITCKPCYSYLASLPIDQLGYKYNTSNQKLSVQWLLLLAISLLSIKPE